MDKVVELVDGGFVINEDTLFSLESKTLLKLIFLCSQNFIYEMFCKKICRKKEMASYIKVNRM